MKIKQFYILLVLCFSAIQLIAQGTYIPINSATQHILDRFEIKSGRLAMPQEFNTTAKAFQRNRIANYVDSFNVKGIKLSKVDYFNLDYLQNDNFEFSNSEATLSKHNLHGVYKYKAAFFGIKNPEFNLVINPVTYLQAGYDTRLKHIVRINNRGVELRGKIGKSLGFFTTFSNEIIALNSWTKDYYITNNVVPGASFLKAYSDTAVLTINHNTASGYIVYQPNKFIDIQMGHGRNFLGNGFRTFYMSDFSRDHFFVRANTRFWRINYSNIWGQIYDYNTPNQRNLPKRHYYAATYANVNLTKNFNLGLFQTVSFQRDSGYSSTGYDLEYLNPIIFYKPVENGLNSPDKVILGADFKFNFYRHFQLYGQGVISEFRIKDMLARNGWFGNKWATQLGLKYIDAFGAKNLDMQYELNIARPYMYTSFNALNSYVNYNQSMAHPLGANFYEQVAIIRYQPIKRLSLKATFIFATYGNDTNGSNWGKNIELAYNSKSLPREYGNEIAQGIKTNLLMTDLLVSYMVKHNLFVDLQLAYRKTASDMNIFNTEALLINGTVRWNFNERRWDF
ncbi:MAG: hypothetical protein KBE91_10190 [Bacteroidia bacterium]|nr:hypothetical protein [Bacteroidia bacterium]